MDQGISAYLRPALLFGAGLLAGVAATGPGALRAPLPVQGGTVPIEALVLAVAAWTSGQTGLPLPGHMPGIAFTDANGMADRVLGTARSAGEHAEIVAFYDTGRGVIHLREDWSGGTPAEISVLVHEMVHHLQASSGAVGACPAEVEKTAYDTQEAWLAVFGSDLQSAVGIDPLYRILAALCGPT